MPSQLQAIEFEGKFLQGYFILGSTNPSAKILVGKKEVKVSKDGLFVFGIDRDRKFDLTFTKIINGKPRWPHYGIDIAAKQGTMIKSSGAGIVTMAEDDLYYTGGTIIMDHGHGISTIYSHLENILVSVGDKINQGDIIGTVGSTGRSTGPHLDFRINWFQTRLDPMTVLK